MITDREFKGWVEATHSLFELLEGRYDAYPLAKKWVDEWCQAGSFTVSSQEAERLRSLKENFDYGVFRVKVTDRTCIDSQFAKLVDFVVSPQASKENVGIAIAPYFFTWNFNRFKHYFAAIPGFVLQSHFLGLGEFIQHQWEMIASLRTKHLMIDEVDEKEIAQAFDSVNENLKRLGTGHNEPVGTAKLLHILAPYYFPLIDNAIARAVGLKAEKRSLTPSDYSKWMVHLKQWIQPRGELIRELERSVGLPIVKLVDEGLYVMCSVNLSARLARLGVAT